MNVASATNPDPHLNGSGSKKKPKISKSRIEVRAKHMGETPEEARAALEAHDASIAARRPQKRTKAKKNAGRRSRRPTVTKAKARPAKPKKSPLELFWELESGMRSDRQRVEQFICADVELAPNTRHKAFEVIRALQGVQEAMDDLRESIDGVRMRR